MKLFIYEHCPFCVRARMIFGLKHVPFELDVIMEGDAETPTRMVGRKVVPILQKDDGSYMPESMDIVRLVDNLAAPHLLNNPRHEALETWTKEAWPLVSKLAVPRFTKGDFRELATTEARAAYTAREEKAFGDLDALMAETPTRLAEINDKLAALETLLDPESAISETDFILFPVLRSVSIVKGVQFGAKTTAYISRICTLAHVDMLDGQTM